MNWKLIFLWPVAVVAEIISVLDFVPLKPAQRLNKLANSIADREYGDPNGRLLQTREQAIAEQKKKAEANL